LQDGVVRIGIGLQTAHTGQPWSPRRWGFATQALQTQANHLWWTDAQKLADALSSARSVRWQADPHIDPFMPILKSGSAQAITVPALFAPVNRYCASFSKWWSQTQLLE
jgi:deoxyribodipyrimidine photo-lyase